MVARSGLFVAPLPGSPPVGTAPTDGRLVLGALFGTSFGLLSGAGVVQSATAMTFTVGQAVWALPDVTNASCVFASPTDSIVLTGSAGPGTGSRIDSIAVKQNNYENADADSRANVILVTGIPSGTPVAPTLTAGYSRYANITVPTSAANAAACTVTILASTISLALQAKPSTTVVTPSAFTGTGVVQNANGSLTLTSCTTLDIVFVTSAYDDYTIQAGLIGPASGTSGIQTAQFLTAIGTPDTAALYSRNGYYNDGSTVTPLAGTTTATSADIGLTYASGAGRLNHVIDLYNFSKAEPSRLVVSEFLNGLEVHRSNSLNNSSQHVGVRLTFALALSGVIRISGKVAN